VKAAAPAPQEDAESSSDELESSDDDPEEGDVNDDERPVWERKPDESLKFREDMPTCWRMVAEPSSLEHPPSLLHSGDPSVHEAEWFSDYFFPMEWWKHDVIPAWSENLVSRGQNRHQLAKQMSGVACGDGCLSIPSISVMIFGTRRWNEFPTCSILLPLANICHVIGLMNSRPPLNFGGAPLHRIAISFGKYAKCRIPSTTT
jgi:hypothetical protein